MLYLQRKIWKENCEDKKFRKVRDHCHYTEEYRSAANSICNLKYSVPKKILIAFHSASNYDYHLIMKESTEGLLKKFTWFTCLEEKTMYCYKNSTVSIEKEVTWIGKNGEDVTKNIS